MRFLQDMSIRRKLTIILMGTSGIAVLLASIVLYMTGVTQYRNSYKSDLGGLARVIGHNCSVALAFSIPEDAEKVLASLATKPSIAYARIFDGSGALFASYARDRSPKTDSYATPLPLPGAQRNYLEIDQEITLNNAVIGKVSIWDDMQSLRTFRRLAFFSLISGISIALVITFLLSTVLRDLIAKPISSLASLSRRVSDEQNFSLRAEKYGNDETGLLVDAWNDMLHQIDTRNTALVSSEKRFRTLIDQAVDAFFLHSQDGQIIDVNVQACDSLGYSREELLTMSVTDIVSSSISDSSRMKLWSSMPIGKPMTTTSEHCHKDGTTFPVEIRFGILEIGNEKLIMASARDISQRIEDEERKVRLENQLQQAQKMESIGTLAGGIAHDFNNILFPILGYTELALGILPEESEVRDYLNEMLIAAHRAKDLAAQILTFSRQETENRSALKLHLLIKETTKLLRASIPSTIEIRTNIDQKCGYILANATQIHQVLMNLCTNAYHAMRDTGGVLAISLAPYIVDKSQGKDIFLNPGRYLRLEISDSGYGMDPETAKRIFEPYFTTKAKGEGTGMGLSVAHGIISSHGGHITVYSELGQGTTFNVYLPTIESEDEVTTEAIEESFAGDEHIMVIDDESGVVNIIKLMLESLGYKVTGFTDPVEALIDFRHNNQKYDLVITDMTMPKVTGYTLAREMLFIRENMRIIMCTGFSEIINEEKAKAAGIKEYVMKPLTVNSLAGTVRKVLDADES